MRRHKSLGVRVADYCYCCEKLEERLALTTVSIVADINQLSTLSSNPRYFTAAGAQTFFVAESQFGTELWKTDGTSSGTFLVKDIKPGPESSFPESLLAVNNLVFFEVGDDVWRSDGTDQGTFLLKQNCALVASTSTGVLLQGDNYFVSDGSVNGTLAVDIDPSSVAVAATEELFVVQDQSSFKRVSIDARVSHFADAKPGWTAFQVGNALIIHEEEPPRNLRIDLTDPSKVSVTGSQPFSRDSFYTSSDVTLFHGPGSWSVSVSRQMSNGQTTGFDISTNAPIREIKATDDGVFWFFSGTHLVKTDGTQEGTTNVKRFDSDVWIHSLSASKNHAVFIVDNGAAHVWASDGTETGTVPLVSPATTHGNPQSLFATEDHVYFTAESPLGRDLWISNGTIEGTHVTDINPGPNGSAPEWFFPISGNRVLFSAVSDELGRELWITDGTVDGTKLVADIYEGEGTGNSSPTEFTEFKGQLFFAANDGLNGVELWRSDGSKSGTTMVADIFPGARSSFPADLTVVGDTIYFVAEDERGRELWSTDGTTTGTKLVADLVHGEQGSFPWSLVTQNDDLYFIARGEFVTIDRSAREWPDIVGWVPTIWKVDEDSASVLYAPPIENNSLLPQLWKLTGFNDAIYFPCWGCESRLTRLLEVKEDGRVTEIGDLLPMPSDHSFDVVRVVDEQLLYVTDRRRPHLTVLDDSGVISQPWGDRVVSEVFYTDIETIVSYLGSGKYSYLAKSQAEPIQLDLAELESVHRSEYGLILVESFLSNYRVKLARDVASLESGNLELLAEFPARFPNYVPRDFIEFQGELYFLAGTPKTGTQIWKTDGTPLGTVQVTDTETFAQGSQPHSLHVVGERLMFAANDGVHGYELWSIAKEVPGDFDFNGVVDSADIDSLYAAIDAGSNDEQYDLNSDGVLNQLDVDLLVHDLLRTEYGDLNLDRKVDFADFLLFAASFENETPGWNQGRTNADNTVGRFASFLLLSTNFGFGL